MDYTPINEISYSEQYEDDDYEYRHAILRTPRLLIHVPRDRLMEENEWRSLGIIIEGHGWEHYMIHRHERNASFF
ncbi:unnamed protein product [Dracunculus medinensis]|uniref:Cyclin-dependent kinases regulatory subunit n=1 Tax=Dracunculus medinensis TaxID=318479 RepID=A0A0N4U4K0_DRAME|nr:unnamed protein product [Dracunculus medinensis]